MINAETLEVAGTIPVGGKPEFAAEDGKGHIFVNIEDTSEALRIVENMSDGSDLEDTDVILDLRCPEITCAACGGEVDFSYNEES